jgi:amino acid adenylation domain-containing protein
MVLLAGLDVLLHRYTGSTDVAVGTAIANRNHLVAESLVGTLVNTLVMRTDLSGEPTFGELLDRVRDVALDAYAHQDAPFAAIVNELTPTRDLARSPLFQVFLNVQNAPFRPPLLGEVSASIEPVDRGAAQFDLSLSVDLEATSQLTVEYDSDLFDGDRIERLVGHLWTLLDAGMSDPSRRIGELPLLTADELARLVRSWDSTTVPFEDNVAAHALVRRQAAATPERVAVRDGGDEFTYEELIKRVNRLANYLVDAGVRPADRVGIHLERGIDIVVALLAVLSAGAAYVPLDPTLPDERLDFMLADASVAVLITHSGLDRDRRLDAVTATPLRIALDQERTAIGAHPATAPQVSVVGSDLAYVMYTSGSTGRPKGVQAEHRNIVNLLHAMSKRPGIAPDDVLVAVTTLSFDISVLELLLPLVVGAQVVVAPRDATVDGAALVDLVAAAGATIVQATPTTWRMLVEREWPGVRRDLVALCGGEPMPLDLARQLLDRCGSVWNMYGPTETTVWSTSHHVQPDDLRASIPIGLPIDNTRCYVLDPAGRVLPDGVPGELHIGGAGVARGYLNRPELTADRFVPDPYDKRSGAIMYRTGDLVRRCRDGRLEHLGRTDYQVKIRGHRIELGEIEAILSEHPGVARAVVVTNELSPGDVRLVAYIVPSGARPPAPGELREYLRPKLTAPMIPVAYVALDSLPLTSNGKLDRVRLPVLSAGAIDQKMGSEPPRPGLERQIADVWERVLGIEGLAREDDFFDLGGHSLLAIRMFAGLEELTGRTLPLTSLFRAPTLASFVSLVRDEPAPPRWTSLVAVKPTGTLPPLFYVSPFPITTLSFAHLARHLGSDQPFYALQPQGMEADAPVHESIEEMAAHYIAEMREVQPSGPYLLGGHCAGSWVAFEIAQQLQAAGDEVGLLILVDSPPPNIEPPRLNRIRYLIGRLQYYQRAGRLWDALRWRFGLLVQHHVVRRVGREETRRVARLREIHAAAHQRYRSGTFCGDAQFIRSEESANLPDKDWHLRWAELVHGDFHVETIPGSHAAMVENTNAVELAAAIRRAADRARR